ncbi:MAG: serine/threonine-protein kinase [Myxococcota bacterium]
MSDRAGKYELLERIGFGGMAEVWRAHAHGEAGFRRPVAVKRLLPNLAGDEVFGAMLLEEARVVAALDHPNIVQTIDFRREDDTQFLLVMELVDGINLGSWIRHHQRARETTPWPLVAMIAMDVLRALSAAHERKDEQGRASPIFHRDVSPSNVLLGKHGNVKLGDFGLARAMDRVTLTTPGVVKGKLSYERQGGV